MQIRIKYSENNVNEKKEYLNFNTRKNTKQNGGVGYGTPHLHFNTRKTRNKMAC